jgi:hypothetical protein
VDHAPGAGGSRVTHLQRRSADVVRYDEAGGSDGRARVRVITRLVGFVDQMEDCGALPLPLVARLGFRPAGSGLLCST